MKKITAGQIIRIIVLCFVLVLLVFALKPSWIPFISSTTRAELEMSLEKYLGQFPSAFAELDLSLSMFIYTLIMFIGLYLLYKLIVFLFGKFAFKDRRRETLRHVTLNFTRYLFVIVGIIWALTIFGVNTAAIFAAVGIVSLVISLGAQSLFSDIFTGIFIIFENQFRVGDIISIDGFRGTVVELGIRTTRIMDVGGNIKIINNSDVKNVLNLSELNSHAVCDISIAYGASIEKAEAVIKKTVEEIKCNYPDTFQDLPEYVGVQELSSSSVVLRVVAKVDEPNIYKGRRILNRELKLAFDRNQIEIPFQQIVIHKAPNNE